MSKIAEKLTLSKGKLFLHNREEERILDYDITGDIVTIRTDKQTYSRGFGDVQAFLSEFLPVDENPVIVGNQVTILKNNGAENLRDILMENINKVRQNKDYIGQAKQINADVNTLIELAKTEIELIRIAGKI